MRFGRHLLIAVLIVPLITAGAMAAPVPKPKSRPPQAPKAALRTTPNVGTPEWHQNEAEEAKAEAEMLKKMQGICRGC
jgi:hypothetical protein